MLAAWGMTRPASPWESPAHPNWKARGILSRWGRLLLQGTEGTGDVQEAPGSMRFWSNTQPYSRYDFISFDLPCSTPTDTELVQKAAWHQSTL